MHVFVDAATVIDRLYRGTEAKRLRPLLPLLEDRVRRLKAIGVDVVLYCTLGRGQRTLESHITMHAAALAGKEIPFYDVPEIRVYNGHARDDLERALSIPTQPTLIDTSTDAFDPSLLQRQWKARSASLERQLGLRPASALIPQPTPLRYPVEQPPSAEQREAMTQHVEGEISCQEMSERSWQPTRWDKIFKEWQAETGSPINWRYDYRRDGLGLPYGISSVESDAHGASKL